MTESKQDLGKLISVHGISPAYLQRGLFVAVLSFFFFLAMMIAFYIRQSIGYFVLATAFLLVYLVTMVSWVLQRRGQLTLFERGLAYRKIRVSWDDILYAEENGEIGTEGGGKFMIPRSINDFGIVLNTIRSRAGL